MGSAGSGCSSLLLLLSLFFSTLFFSALLVEDELDDDDESFGDPPRQRAATILRTLASGERGLPCAGRRREAGGVCAVVPDWDWV
ncbi:hypothetical protein B0H13DRAFT_2046903 [Mycena leptocephala]|nr:hypothetical protein B0H13DRAFT_2046903 [Mycena leptocephala]